jgi:hypothetical protein
MFVFLNKTNTTKNARAFCASLREVMSVRVFYFVFLKKLALIASRSEAKHKNAIKKKHKNFLIFFRLFHKLFKKIQKNNNIVNRKNLVLETFFRGLLFLISKFEKIFRTKKIEYCFKKRRKVFDKKIHFRKIARKIYFFTKREKNLGKF